MIKFLAILVGGLLLTTVSLNFYSGEGNGLKSLTVGTTLDITSNDGKNSDVIVVHDLP